MFWLTGITTHTSSKDFFFWIFLWKHSQLFSQWTMIQSMRSLMKSVDTTVDTAWMNHSWHSSAILECSKLAMCFIATMPLPFNELLHVIRVLCHSCTTCLCTGLVILYLKIKISGQPVLINSKLSKASSAQSELDSLLTATKYWAIEGAFLDGYIIDDTEMMWMRKQK